MAKGKKGGILVLALLVMFVGAIILGGLFLYLDTSLSLATKSEDGAINYYAADSGVEDAIVWLQHEPWLSQVEPLGGDCDPQTQECENTYQINTRNVSVNVEKPTGFDDLTFNITSTATNNDESTSTTIVSVVKIETADLPAYLDNALISNGDLQGGSDGFIEGGAIYVDDLEIGGGWTGDDPEPVSSIADWPVAQDLIDFYLQDVDESDPYPGDEIKITEDTELGPLYWSGDKLVITADADNVTLTLTGTIYVKGELEIAFSKAGCYIDLNGQTIFVEGTTGNPAIKVVSNVQFDGSGAILATGGDIYIASDVSTELGDPENPNYILCMAVDGMLDLQSSDDWYGTLAGHDVVSVQSNGSYLYKGYSDINVPWIIASQPAILTYDIIDR